MKPLFSALLEMIVLVVSILLVMLCAKLLKFDSSFDNYSEKYPDSIITVGNAMDYFPEGTDPTPEEASVLLGKEWFGEDSGKDDHAPYGGYGYLEPIMLKDKSVIFRGTFIRRCTAIASAEKADAATRAESITPQNNKVSFKCTADATGSWRVRKEFTGTGAEAAADAWLKSQFSPT